MVELDAATPAHSLAVACSGMRGSIEAALTFARRR